MDSLVDNNRNKYLENNYKSNIVVKDLYVEKLIKYLINKYFPGYKKNYDEVCLDLGCGNGLQASYLANYFNVKCLDIADNADLFFKKNKLDIEFKKCDLENDSFPFLDNIFNLIFSKSVIEHVKNTDHFLSESYRVLKPSGAILILTPAWETQYKCFYDDYTHVTPFTKHGLNLALKTSGFKNIVVEEFYQLPFMWNKPYLSLIPKLISFLPDRFKFKNGERTDPNKIIRFSKETMLIAVANK